MNQTGLFYCLHHRPCKLRTTFNQHCIFVKKFPDSSLQYLPSRNQKNSSRQGGQHIIGPPVSKTVHCTGSNGYGNQLVNREKKASRNNPELCQIENPQSHRPEKAEQIGRGCNKRKFSDVRCPVHVRPNQETPEADKYKCNSGQIGIHQAKSS